MYGFRSTSTPRRAGAVALAAAAAALLAGCNGGSNSVPGFGTTNGFIRFVNGSADAGSIDVLVDGNKVNTSPLAYGGITAYSQLSATGSHTVTINAAGTSTVIGNISGKSIGVNGSNYESFVLTGEAHPVAAANTLNLIQFVDQTFSSSSNGSVNFHNAAPGISATQNSVAFGWFVGGTPSTNQQLGTSETVGNETGPQALPANAASSASIGFYAVSPVTGGYTTLPSNIDSTGCATNKFPCNTGNLSLYFIDGPAASTTPSAGPYPAGITSASQAGFVGIFDASGT